MTRRIAGVVLMLLFVAASGAIAEDDAPPRTISVTGNAVEQVVPDTVVWQIETRDYHKDLETAKKESGKKLAAVRELAAEFGIEEADITVGQLTIAETGHAPEHKVVKEFDEFALVRTIRVTQRDIERFDAFFVRLVSEIEMDLGLRLEASRLTEIEQQVTAAAVRDARAKATAIAQELGVKLGDVVSVEVDANDKSHYYAGGAYCMTGIVSEITTWLSKKNFGGPLSPGIGDVHVAVSAIFEIE